MKNTRSMRLFTDNGFLSHSEGTVGTSALHSALSASFGSRPLEAVCSRAPLQCKKGEREPYYESVDQRKTARIAPAKFPIFFVAVLTGLALTTGPASAQGWCQPNTLVIDQVSVATYVSHKRTHRSTIRVTGTITNEGVECTALRGDNGKLYTLAGWTGGFKSGDRVRVIGKIAQASFCMQGTTIEVRRVVALK